MMICRRMGRFAVSGHMVDIGPREAIKIRVDKSDGSAKPIFAPRSSLLPDVRPRDEPRRGPDVGWDPEV